MPEQSEKPPRSYSSLIFWGVIAFIFIKTFPLISPILLALLLIILLSLALNPLVAKLRRLSGGRSPATAIVVLFFLIVAGLTGWAFYHPVKRSTTEFVQRLPEYWERIQKPVFKMQQRAAASEEKLHREAAQEVTREIARTNEQRAAEVEMITGKQADAKSQTVESNGILKSGVGQFFGGITGTFKTIAANTLEMVTIALTVFVGVIFTLLNPRALVAFTFSVIPERHHPKAMIVLKRIIAVIPEWALATVFGMAVIGLMTFFAMWLILGFQDAIVLGVIAFIFEAVPYIGPMLAVIPAALLAVNHGGWTPLWVVLAYMTIQLIENHFIVPKVIAGRLKLHPVAAIFSVLLCVATFGVFGILLAVPLVAVARILHQELFRPRFLPGVSDEQLEAMAKTALNEKPVSRSVMFRRSRRPRPVRKHERDSPNGKD